MSRDDDKKDLMTRRTFILGGGKAILFGSLLYRLYSLQIQSSQHYKMLSDKNRLQSIWMMPQRGVILDKHHRLLAFNKPAYQVSYIRDSSIDFNKLMDDLDNILGLGEEEVEQIKKNLSQASKHSPLLIRNFLSWDEVARLQLHLPELPGINVEESFRREYAEGDLFGHVTGYIGVLSPKEIENERESNNPIFLVGKSGLEKNYDPILKGVAGIKQLEVNAFGKIQQEIKTTSPMIGETLSTTLDLSIQHKIKEIFAETPSGVAVVMDVKEGGMLGLYSHPSYNPNLFVGGIKKNDWKELLENPYNPLINKAIAGLYAPGSTVKMILALAALRSQLISPDRKFFCPGYYELGQHRFHCHTWARGGCGHVNMKDAIIQSCDVYFYHVGLICGVDRLSEMAHLFGLGALTGIDLPGEKKGIVPSRSWKQKVFRKEWTTGETLNTSIGQGYFLATPLQIVRMISALSNGGVLIQPHLKQDFAPEKQHLDLDPEHLKLVQEGMFGVCNDPKGTALHLKIDEANYQIAGKTGTCQVKRLTMQERQQGKTKAHDFEWKFRDHAFFVGYGPYHDPKYAICLLVEHGGSGGKVAGPMGKALLEHVMKTA